MAFTVADFEDLYRLLAEHPEWRNRLRPLILGDEFLEVPGRLEHIEQLLAQSVERQAAFEERQAAFEANMAGFAERQASFEASMVGFGERQAAFEASMAAFHERQTAFEERQAAFEANMAGFAERQTAFEASMAAFHERQTAFEERQAAFEANMAAFAERMDRFEERMDRFDARLEQLVAVAQAHERRLNRMDGRMGNIEGLLLEQRYRDYYPDWLADHLHGSTRTFIYQLSLVDAGVRDGTITREELERVRNLDLIVRGTLPDGSAREALLVVEISYTVNPDDIARVADRADILRRAGYEVIAMAGGYRIEPETATLAHEAGVIVDLRRTPDAAVA